MQGTKVPIQTSVNNTISVQYIDAVLQLVVTPQITADGTVYMDVLVENTSIDPGIARIQGIPALATQSAETKTTIADGGTVVIGGVIVSYQRTDVKAGATGRQRSADRPPVQAHSGQRFLSGTAILHHAADSAGLGGNRNFGPREETTGLALLLLFFYGHLPTPADWTACAARSNIRAPTRCW